MTTQNISLILARHPTGYPIPGEDLILQSTPINLTEPPPPGGLLLKTLALSLDPLQNHGIFLVLLSDNPLYTRGSTILGPGTFSTYQVIPSHIASLPVLHGGFTLLSNPLNLNPHLFLGALGMSGLTAYSSFYSLCKPKQKGETILISAASGAVGSIVGQLAKREGMRVLGCVGSEEKLKFIVEELGFDGGFNYKKEGGNRAGLRKLLSDGEEGVDVYYDNVGGEMLDACLEVMNDFGRVVLCGSISQTSLSPSQKYGLKNIPLVVRKRLTLRGFIVSDPDMGPKYIEEQQTNMQKWIKEGEIKVKMDVTHGMENAAEGFVRMLRGSNFGKAVLAVAE